MRLFHVTTEKNLPSIQEHGLIPTIGERSRLIDENIKKIYFFESLDDAGDGIANWLGELFHDNSPLVILEVEVEKAKTVKDAFEYQVKEIITPDRIAQIYDENLDPLMENPAVVPTTENQSERNTQKSVAAPPRFKL